MQRSKDSQTGTSVTQSYPAFDFHPLNVFFSDDIITISYKTWPLFIITIPDILKDPSTNRATQDTYQLQMRSLLYLPKQFYNFAIV